MVGPVVGDNSPGELGGHVELVMNGRESVVTLSPHGVQVTAPHGLVLDVTYKGLRRIQLDIEQDRPATFVLVPHNPHDHPQVVSIPAEEYGAAGQMISIIGNRLARLDG